MAGDELSKSESTQTKVDDVDWRHVEFRMWLMLLMSLTATVTFTAGHAPPGGVWSADDNANGHVAGTSVMRDKFHCRYLVFYYSNSIAFFMSLAVMVMLARIKTKENNQTRITKNDPFIALLVSVCIASLGTSYIAGSWESSMHVLNGIIAFGFVLLYMSWYWIAGAFSLFKKTPSTGQKKALAAGAGNA